MPKLALFGGEPAVKSALPPFVRVGEDERKEVDKVLSSGELSGFVGAMCDEFNGGTAVQALERAWERKFECKHAISVNSNTSGLFAAMGAIGLSAGDEVIVPPYTMSATVMAPLVYGGVPVFVDIEPNFFCLDPDRVREAITPRTKAILAVNLFGHPAALSQLREVADENDIYLIEDNAQAPLAIENNRFAGTIGHIGVFSLNRHKHIQTGEGGICTTDDDELALRLSLIRNHGENLIDPLGRPDLSHIVGFNYRLSELSAAIGIAQLEKVDSIVQERVVLAEELTRGLTGIDGIKPPAVRDDCSHVYYIWAARFDEDRVGVPRDLFAKALAAEGFVNSVGYIEPLYRLPRFRDTAYPGNKLTVCERMYTKEVLEFFICSYDPDDAQTAQLIDAFHKVYEHRDELQLVAPEL